MFFLVFLWGGIDGGVGARLPVGAQDGRRSRFLGFEANAHGEILATQGASTVYVGGGLSTRLFNERKIQALGPIDMVGRTLQIGAGAHRVQGFGDADTGPSFVSMYADISGLVYLKTKFNMSVGTGLRVVFSALLAGDFGFPLPVVDLQIGYHF